MNKLTFWLFSALVFPLTMMAQTWDDAKYKAIEASIVAPKFADKEFDITALMTVGSGKSNVFMVIIPANFVAVILHVPDKTFFCI